MKTVLWEKEKEKKGEQGVGENQENRVLGEDRVVRKKASKLL